MKSKTQREFLRQRRQYEKELKKRAKSDDLSLQEKLEFQQIHRNRYRERLFHDSQFNISSSFHSFISYKIWSTLLFVGVIVILILWRFISNLIHPIASSYPDYSYDIITDGQSTHVVDPKYNEVYHAILDISADGNYLYDTYYDAQLLYESNKTFSIDTLYDIETFYYNSYDFLKESLFTSLDNLHQDILNLAKAEYSNSSLSDAEIEVLKAAIEISKATFDEQITLAMADLGKATLGEHQ